MNAAEFFSQVCEPNVISMRGNTDSFMHLWNAAVSLNHFPEWLALHELGYQSGLCRGDIDGKTEEIRKREPSFQQLQAVADALKHARKHKGPTMTHTATDAQTGRYVILGADRREIDIAAAVLNAFQAAKRIAQEINVRG